VEDDGRLWKPKNPKVAMEHNAGEHRKTEDFVDDKEEGFGGEMREDLADVVNLKTVLARGDDNASTRV